MELYFQFTLLVIGLVLLWKTGDLSVRFALGFSSIYGISRFTVGFLIFAISTGLPEICSAIISSINKVPQLSLGDLMGSTFINLSLILGIISIYAGKMEVEPSLKKKLLKTSILIFLLMVCFVIFREGSLIFGITLIVIYFGSIYWLRDGLPYDQAKEEIKIIEREEIEKKALLSPKVDIFIKLFGSLGLLLISSWITVHSATNLAKLMNINLTLLGGTILAIGTSFPELVLELHAIRKKEYALALGDLFGSSLLNISLILGMLMLMNSGIDLSYSLKLLPFILAVLLWTLQRLIRKSVITKNDGIIFLFIFACYLGYSLYSYFSVV